MAQSPLSHHIYLLPSFLVVYPHSISIFFLFFSHNSLFFPFPYVRYGPKGYLDMDREKYKVQDSSRKAM